MKKLLRIKRNLCKVCLILVLLFPVLNILAKGSLSNVNLEVQRVQREIYRQNNNIESISMKINELKSIANLETVILEEGLTYNSSKIRVISQ